MTVWGSFWRRGLVACASMALVGAGACGGASDPGETRVQAVALSDTALQLRIGDQAALTASARGSGGSELVGRPIFWASRDPGIVTVSQSGVVQAVGVGSTQIAASAEGQTSVARITVLSRPITTVQVAPATVQLMVNGRQVLTARALNDAGAVAPATVTWTTTTPTIVSVSGAGEVVALAPGLGSVVATAEGVDAMAAVVVTAIPVASVVVAPAAPTITVGATQTLVATARDANGAALSGRTVSWTSRDPGIAVVSSSGQVTGIAPGSASVVAVIEGQTATASVTVLGVPVAAVAVTPSTASVGVGASIRLVATPSDAAGNVLSGRAIAYTSTAPNVASVTSDGVVTGVASGSATIRAVSEGVTGTATVQVVTVQTSGVSSVEITPSSATLAVGDTRTFTAVPRARDGSAVTGRTVTWSSGGPGVVTVSSSGVATAVGEGSAQLLAQVDGITGTASVTVARIAAAAVSVSPDPATIAAGTSTQLTATVRDAGGRVLGGRLVTWSTSDANIVSVTSDGTITGTNPGTATVRATSDGVSRAVTVTVNAVVRVSPTAVSVRDRSNSNRTAQLVATDHTGRLLSSDEVTWSSSDPATATVDATGLVRGVSSGSGGATAVITANYRGATATATVTVTRN